MRVFVVLGLFFHTKPTLIDFGKRFRNDLFCVEWEVKSKLNQSLNLQFYASFWRTDSLSEPLTLRNIPPGIGFLYIPSTGYLLKHPSEPSAEKSIKSL